jgi:hypothetical protein
MGWNNLHQFAMENKVDQIHDDIYKKGTIVREATELVRPCQADPRPRPTVLPLHVYPQAGHSCYWWLKM